VSAKDPKGPDAFTDPAIPAGPPDPDDPELVDVICAIAASDLLILYTKAVLLEFPPVNTPLVKIPPITISIV
jgi:hypothetical protein